MAVAAPSPATPPAGGTARRPIAVVKLDGTELTGWISVKTTNNAHSQADTFEVEIPLQKQPATANWSAWGNDISPVIEVLYGQLDPQTNQRSALISAVIGPVDSIEIKQPENVATLRGRDFSGALIDTQTYQNFTNQTASQIATAIAQSHGLTAQVTPTTTPVGAKDEETGEYSRVTRRESEWDLLTNLARNEGYVCYVRGKTLYFQPDQPPSGPAYPLVWKPAQTPGGPPQANFTKLVMKRAFTLAKGIKVKIVSHDPHTGKTIQATNSTKGVAAGKLKTSPQTYTIDVPGLTQAQAQARADQIAQLYGRFERVVEFKMPGDPFLTFEQPISLTGTGTDWDNQLLYADRIERSLSMHGGFHMDVRAKNHSTGQTVTSIPGAAS